MIEPIYRGIEIKTDTAFNQILDIAKFRMIGCIFAQVDTIPTDKTSEYISLEEYNHDAADALLIDISKKSYDYFETRGGWVSPDGTKSEVRGFMVVGPDYQYPDRVNAFKGKMVQWCRNYYQWAVLIIGLVNIDCTPTDQLNAYCLDESLFGKELRLLC